MRVFTERVGADNAILTGYVLDESDELLNARPSGRVGLAGGGYFMTSDREAEPVAMAYIAEGFNAFVLRYASVRRPIRAVTCRRAGGSGLVA